MPFDSSKYFQNMDVVKIKCGNSFSENEVKGHQPVLTVHLYFT